jgi:XTP/dITP diphosphohydrolase
MKQIVVATKNPNKAREYRELFAPWQIEVKTLADFDQSIEIEENGITFEENALIKAQAVVTATQLPVVADDSGLVVDALDGAPGIHSARYAGDHDDGANNDKLLANLVGVSMDQRTAHFHTTLVALKPNGQKLVANGDVNGLILTQRRGENGFGYDPLFFLPKLNSAMAELTDEQKNSVSHRGRAMRQMMTQFESWWTEE